MQDGIEIKVVQFVLSTYPVWQATRIDLDEDLDQKIRAFYLLSASASVYARVFMIHEADLHFPLKAPFWQRGKMWACWEYGAKHLPEQVWPIHNA